ncbi:filamentous hemagglutinin N-terminal domain-containing protein [Sansalvadorimonas sp. 2012CJ34-2]|uniref:Filamentous hemagglutinin N-terminal domain-containing protein n=1 Tax=Parendozoicomonas callyspongiae TaxID=2942213 RepID=A0ABT0PE81_9GAMM|nr:filamentous hemagglutinin N-terminal domain-containing protein [Sansalvadorimonas sp. 2012CJ34-2]MCL6269351.1 filamentous hemagglutinin N-terminal domain-containing protein [Sansalvadorimonas sp. 2012CJ34-2]
MKTIDKLPQNSRHVSHQIKLTSIAKALKLQNAGLSQGLILLSLMSSGAVFAAPQGGVVVGGSGSISNSGKNTNIIQNTDKLAINWDSFNVNTDEKVKFIQPSSSSLVLNRVLDENPSMIHGSIDANGHVLLVNPRGVLFTETARINVNSMTASSLDIQTEDFMNGKFAFKGGGKGAVINKGVINAASGVVLQGEQVVNNGLIAADMVALAGGSETVLIFDSDQLIGVRVTKEILESQGVDSAVLNTGTIEAGEIVLTAQTAKGLFDTAVNNEGILEARGINARGGTIRLGGFGGRVADVVNSGTIDVSASGTNAKGGRVQVEGDSIQVKENSRIIATGDNGGGTVLIGGDYQGKNPDIHNATKVVVEAGSQIDASALEHGNGGKVIVWSDDTAVFAGEIKARGGVNTGDGGFVETSGKKHLTVTGRVNAGAPKGKSGNWLLDPENVTIKSGDNTEGVTGSIVYDEALEQALLDDTNITITATKNNSLPDGDSGNIKVEDNTVIDPSIGSGNAVSLTLNADNDITFGQGSGIGSKSLGDFNLFLNADNTVYIAENAVLNTHGGNFSSDSKNFINHGTINLDRDSIFDEYGNVSIQIGRNNQDGVGYIGTIINAASTTISATGSGYNTFVYEEGTIGFSDNDVTIDSQKLNGADAVAFGTVTYNGTIDYTGNSNGSLTGTGSDETFQLGENQTFGNYVRHRDINFSGLGTVDAGGGDNTINGSNSSNNFELTGADRVVKSHGTTFSGISTVNAGGGANTLTGSDEDDTFKLTGTGGQIVGNSITLNSISGPIDAGSKAGNTDNDTLVGTAGNDEFSLTGSSKQVDTGSTAGGFLFTGIEIVDAGNGTEDKVVGTNNNDNFSLTDNTNELIAQGITFKQVEQADAGSGSDNTVTGRSSADTYKLTGINKQVISQGITFQKIARIVDTSTNNILIGSASTDTFTLESNTNSTGNLTANGIEFKGITGNIDGKGGSDVLEGTTSDSDTFSINGVDNQVDAGGRIFIGIAQVDGNGGTDTVNGTSGNDTFELTDSNNSVKTNEITFNQITSVNAGEGSDTLNGSSDVDTFALTGTDGEFKGNLIRFTGITEDINAQGGADVLQGTNDADNFTLSSVFNKVSSAALTFLGISSVQAGTGDDTVTGADSATDFILETGNNQVTSQQITFSDIQLVSGGGDNSTNNSVKGTDNQEEYLLTGQNRQLITKGITFSNIGTVNSQQGSDTLTGSAQADSFELTGITNQIKANGIAFNDTAKDINAGGGNDTLTGTASDDSFELTTIAEKLIAGEFTISDLESVDGAGSDDTGNTLKGTSADDQYALTANTAEFIARGITFTRISEVKEDVHNNTLTGSTANDTFTVTNSTATQNDVMGNGVLFNGIANPVDGNGGNDTLVGTSGNDKFYLRTADNSVQSEGMVFTGISNVNGAHGQGSDSIIGTGGDEEFTLQATNNVIKAKEVVFSNITSVSGNGGSDSVKGFDANDNYLATGTKALTAKEVNFTGISTIAGTAATLTNNAGFQTVEIAGGALKLLGMSFDDVISYVGHSALDNVTDTDGGDWVTGAGQNSASKGPYNFSNIKAVATSGTARLSSSVAVDPNSENDAQIVEANNDGLKLKGINFLGALGFDGVSNRGDEINDITGFKWAITGNRASTRKANLGDQTFTDISKITTAGDIEDNTNSAWTVDDQKLATSTVNNLTVSNSSKIVTTGKVSNASNSTQEVALDKDNGTNTIALAGITFHGSKEYLGSTTNGVNDNITDNLGRTWGITGQNALAQTDDSITLGNINKLSGVSTVSNDTSDGLTATINSDSTLNVAGILFANAKNYTGHATKDDSVNDNRTSGDWTINADSLTTADLTFKQINSVDTSASVIDGLNSDWNVTTTKSVSNGALTFTGLSGLTSTGKLSNKGTTEQTVVINKDTSDLELLGVTFKSFTSYDGHGNGDQITDNSNSGWKLEDTRKASSQGRIFTNIDAVSTTGDIIDGTTSDWVTDGNKVATAKGVTFTGTTKVTMSGSLSSDATSAQTVEAKADSLKLAAIDFVGATGFTGKAGRKDKVSDSTGNNWEITGIQTAKRALGTNPETYQSFSLIEKVTTAGEVADNTTSNWTVDGQKLATSTANNLTISGSSRITTTGQISNASKADQNVTLGNDNGTSTIALADMTFHGSKSYQGSGEIGVNDNITDSQGRAWKITGTQTLTTGTGSDLISLSRVDKLANVSDITNGTGTGLAVAINADSTLTSAQVLFADATRYTGVGNDTINDSRTGDAWTLNADDSLVTGALTFNQVRNINSSSALTDTTGGDWLVTGTKAANNTELFFNGTSSITSTGGVTNSTGSEKTVLVTSAGDLELMDITFSGASIYTGHADGDTVTDNNNNWELTGDNQAKSLNRTFNNIDTVITTGDVDGNSSNWITSGDKVATAKGITFTGITKVTEAGSLTSDASTAQEVEAKAGGLRLAAIDFVDATGFTGNARRGDTINDTSGNIWTITGNQAASRVFGSGSQSFTNISKVTTAGNITDGTNSAWTIDAVKNASSSTNNITVAGTSQITGTGSVTSTMAGQDITLNDSNLSVGGISFTGTKSYTGNSDHVIDQTTGTDDWQVKGGKSAIKQTYTLNEIASVATDNAVTNSSTGTLNVTVDDDSLAVGGIDFQGSHSYIGHSSGDTVSDKTTADTSWLVRGSKQVNKAVTSDPTPAYYQFGNIVAVNTTKGVTNSTNADQTVTLNSDNLTIADIQFKGATEYTGHTDLNDTIKGSANTWQLYNQNNKVSSSYDSGQTVTFNDVKNITDNTGTVFGTDGDDTFTVNSTTDSLESRNIVFTGIDTLNAGGQSTDAGDIIQGTNETWTLNGMDKQVMTDKLTLIENIETINGNNSGTLRGTNGNDEFNLELRTDNGSSELYVQTNEMAFKGMKNLDGNGLSDKVIASKENHTWKLQLDQSGAIVNGSVKVNDLTITDIDTITDAGGGIVVGTTADDIFTITGDKSFTASEINFAGIGTVDGNGGNDTAKAGDNIAIQWQLKDSNNVFSAAGIDFSDIRNIIGNGYEVSKDEREELIGTSKNDEFQVVGDNALLAKNINFTGIRFIHSGAGDADNVVGNNAKWSLNNTDGSLIASGMTFFETERAAEQSGSGTLTGSNLDDTIFWQGNKTLTSDGVEFTGFTNLNTGAGNDTVYIDGAVDTLTSLAGGNDSDTLINRTAGLGWELTSSSSSLGGLNFTAFEHLTHTLSEISLVTDSNINLSSNNIGLPSAQNTSIDISSVPLFSLMQLNTSGSLSGLAKTSEIDATVAGGVDITTNNTLLIDDIISTGGNVSVKANRGDILINGLVASLGNGTVTLESTNGSLLADGDGVHIQAHDINLTAADAVGSQDLPFTITSDFDGTVRIEALTYVRPLFTGAQALLETSGQRLLSFAEIGAMNGLRNASQNLINQLGNVDPAIFTAISSFSVAENSVAEPAAGDFMVAQNDGGYSIQALPIEATAAGEEEELAEEECTVDENCF